MAKYYGVERSDEYLAHYGVRGMKWGVRKAIAEGGGRGAARLSKHYQKAVKKLGKLSLNANQDVQKKLYSRAKANMAQGAAISAGMSAGLTAGLNNHLNWKGRLKYGGIAGAAGALGGALINSKGFGAGRYASNRGHARAVAKRDAWRREMESTFKGTQYGGKEQRRFHQQITAISDQRDPRAYVAKQQRRAAKDLERARRRRG